MVNKEKYIKVWIDELEWNIARFNEYADNEKISINDVINKINERKSTNK